MEGGDMPSSHRSNKWFTSTSGLDMKENMYLTLNCAVVQCLMSWPGVPLVTARAEENGMRAAPPCVFQEKTLTQYWHLCFWGVKCYITQRSEKSKRLEAEGVFPPCEDEIESAEGEEKMYCSHTDEELWGKNSCRGTFEARRRAKPSRCLRVWNPSGK